MESTELYETYVDDVDDFLEHHGILGQKWGVRRFQYADGTLTPAGKRRYNVNSDGSLREKNKDEKKAYRKEEKRQNLRDKMLKNPDPAKIRKHMSDFTSDEINEMSAKIKAMNNLKQMEIDKYAKTGARFVAGMTSAANIVGSTGRFIDESGKAWDSVAKTINSLTDADLPLINSKKEKADPLAVKKRQKEMAELDKNIKKLTNDLTEEIAREKYYKENPNQIYIPKGKQDKKKEDED